MHCMFYPRFKLFLPKFAAYATELKQKLFVMHTFFYICSD